MKKIAITLTLLCVVAFAQQKGTLKDTRDGKTYKTVKIGTQTWMAENLNYAAKGSLCLGNKPVNCTKYGRQYSKASVLEACPKGWHLPTDIEWDELFYYADSTGSNETKYLKTDEWKSCEPDDKLGFSAISPAFTNSGYEYWWAYWWSDNDELDLIFMRGCTGEIEKLKASTLSYWTEFSVRCVQGDKETEVKALTEARAKRKEEVAKKAEAYIKANGGTFTDTRDKKNYKTIKIGTQIWLAENLNYAAENSKCYKDSTAYCDKYGRLYDKETAKKACPAGWHLPNTNEWSVLNNTVGKNKREYALKHNSGWNKNEKNGRDGNGSNEFGFSALPGGSGYSYDGRFSSNTEVGEQGSWWSSTPYYVPICKKSNCLEEVIDKSDSSLRSIRCIKDEGAQQPSAQPAAKPAEQPKQAEQAKQADQPKQQSSKEYCNITFPKKACVEMSKSMCKMAGGKTVDKCK